MTRKPTIRRVFTGIWTHDTTQTPAVLVMSLKGICAVLTPAQAIDFANELVDAAEHLDTTRSRA